MTASRVSRYSAGPPKALAPVRDLRVTVLVTSLKEIEELILETGWTREGTLGSTGSMLTRDPDGNPLESVEEVADEPSKL